MNPTARGASCTAPSAEHHSLWNARMSLVTRSRSGTSSPCVAPRYSMSRACLMAARNASGFDDLCEVISVSNVVIAVRGLAGMAEAAAVVGNDAAARVHQRNCLLLIPRFNLDIRVIHPLR